MQTPAMNLINAVAVLGLLSPALPALGFESTSVLPKGIRRLTIKTVNTGITHKTDGDGVAQDLANPLQKNVQFKDILAEETQLKQNQIMALMKKQGFTESDSLGQMNAEMKGDVTVTAPVFSYGLNENHTLAVAVPYYSADMAIEMGFKPSDNAQAFVNSLGTPQSNQVAAARSAGEKLNNALPDLNTKLEDNGFARLDPWQDRGIGDITLASKFRFLNQSVFKLATLNGLVLPTGRVDDPDNLIDVPFGDGSLDVFASIIADQAIGWGFTLNQFAKYTAQTGTELEKRLITEDEKIEVEKAAVYVNHGDKIDVGGSIQYEAPFGMTSGVGVTLFKRFQDQYEGPSDEVVAALESGTDQDSTSIEGKIGYSGINAYRNGSIPVPFTTTVEYKRQLSSRNSPTGDLVTLDVSLFF